MIEIIIFCYANRMMAWRHDEGKIWKVQMRLNISKSISSFQLVLLSEDMSEYEDHTFSGSSKDECSSTFLWVIKDVMNFPIRNVNNSASVFCAFSENNRFVVTCNILLIDRGSEIDLQVESDKCVPNVFISFSVGVLDCEFNKKYEEAKSFHDLSSYRSFDLKNFLSQKHMTEHKKTLLHNEDLILSGKLTVTVIKKQTQHSIYCISKYSHFSQNLRTLLKDGAFSDFSINVQGKKFLCHKVVLAARSEYFEALFNSCMKESLTQELAVTDSEADVMEQVFSYIYTNTLDITSSNVDSILNAAEKYLLHDLKLMCEKKMHNYFSFDNCGEFSKVATTYDLPTVKIKALHMRTLFTKQFEARDMSSTVDYKVEPAAVCETPHGTALPDDPSKANLGIKLNEQIPFLPYADLWMDNSSHVLFEHTWRIENFTNLKPGTVITRNLSDDVYKASYKLEISFAQCGSSYNQGYPCGKTSQLDFHVKLNFSILSSQSENSCIEFRTSIGSISHDPKNDTHFAKDLKVGGSANVFSKHISQNDLNSLLHNGDLLLNCKCWILSHSCCRHKLPHLDDNPIAEFSSTYTSHKFSDLTIKVGSSEFQCHKAMLCCRSRFFAQKLKERKNDVTITLDDIDEETFEKILRYIYTDQYDFVEADAWKLFPFASKYELGNLKEMCVKHLISSLNLENAVDALQLSISNSAPTLREHALRSIGENFPQILARPDIKDQIKKCNISELF